ncbi:MazG-like family protein [Streptomyces sp. NPDC091209]|uniref:MazG-like family protein n=1 Tax=Streptomyces sp. NPDC091209 TaxID=3365974 RepID=UPI003827A658
MFEIRVICAPQDTERVVAALDSTFTTGTVSVHPTRDGHRNRLYARAEHQPETATGVMPWTHVRTVVAWLDATNGTNAHETGMRLLKVTEETGEVAQAYIGMQGQNPRKGFTHSPGDVATELCDVILAAMVALHEFDDDPAALLNTIAAHRHNRLADLIENEPSTTRR